MDSLLRPPLPMPPEAAPSGPALRPEPVVLLCRARGRLWALPAELVVETMRPLPVVPLPAAPPFVLGVARIRGAAVPVVDLGVLLAAPGASRVTRFVTLRLAKRGVALAVEELVGVRRVDSASLGALPPLLQGASEQALAAVGTLDAELLLLLEAGRLVPDTLWAALEAGGAA